MTQQATAEDQVIETMHGLGTCDLEDLTRRCSTLTWNQVFLVVDRLSRTGQVKLMYANRGSYTLTLLRRQGSRPDRQSLPS
jgi:hypothetical protein